MGILKLRSELVEWRLVDDEVIALDLRTSRYLGLNHTAALLWQSIAEGTTEAHLVERVMAAYDIDSVHATKDVDVFISDLRDRGLLHTEPDPTGATTGC